MTENTVKVTVQDPFRVIHEGKTHTAGDAITVASSIAAKWERAGWVRSAPEPKASVK